MNQYFYLDDNREPQGPHSLADLARLRSTGVVTDATLAAERGGDSWRPIGELLAEAPGTLPAQPPVSGAASALGPCPGCHAPVPPDAAGALPERCPSCYRRLRVGEGGLWANFCAALGQYVTFSGRATRKEFWSFIIISHTIICLFLLVLLWPMSIMFDAVMKELGVIGVEQLQQMSEAEIRACLEPVLQGTLTESMQTVLTVGGIGLLVSAVLFFLPSLAVTFRRLHDSGKSGWWAGIWVILSFIPSYITGLAFWFLALAILVFCLIDSQRGTNAYGPSAKYPRG